MVSRFKAWLQLLPDLCFSAENGQRLNPSHLPNREFVISFPDNLGMDYEAHMSSPAEREWSAALSCLADPVAAARALVSIQRLRVPAGVLCNSAWELDLCSTCACLSHCLSAWEHQVVPAVLRQPHAPFRVIVCDRRWVLQVVLHGRLAPAEKPSWCRRHLSPATRDCGIVRFVLRKVHSRACSVWCSSHVCMQGCSRFG